MCSADIALPTFRSTTAVGVFEVSRNAAALISISGQQYCAWCDTPYENTNQPTSLERKRKRGAGAAGKGHRRGRCFEERIGLPRLGPSLVRSVACNRRCFRG